MLTPPKHYSYLSHNTIWGQSFFFSCLSNAHSLTAWGSLSSLKDRGICGLERCSELLCPLKNLLFSIQFPIYMWQLRINGLFYISKDFVTITAHNGFVPLFPWAYIATSQATCFLYTIMAFSDTVTAQSFNIIFISTISHPTRRHVLSKHDFLC